MKINNVKPFVLGIGSLVAASASAALDEVDDELLVAQPLASDAVILTGSNEGEGECGEDEDGGEGEGECGEGQCGEDEGEDEGEDDDAEEEDGEDDSEE